MRRLFLFSMFAALTFSRAEAQQILYTSFGPGESYGDPGFDVGAGQSWLLSGNNGAIDAMAFTPSMTCPFWRVDFSMRYGEPPGSLSNGGVTNFFGPPDLNIQLTADDGGLPGSVLETFQLSNVLSGISAPGVFSVFSVAHPVLNQGEQYWMVVSAPDLLNTAFSWNLGPNGIASTTYTSQVLVEVTSLEGWSGATFPQGARPAMSVYGGSPSALPLPVIVAGGIGNAASYTATTALAPGSWISIFGLNLSQTSRGWQASDFAKDGSLPTSLDGVSVLVNGWAAAISYVSPGQVNVLVPDVETYQFPLAVQLITQAGASLPIPVTMPLFDPAIFTSNQEGTTYAAATFSDGTLVSKAKPATPGSVVVLYGTGFGPSSPAIASGVPVEMPEPLSYPDELTVDVGGVPASVLYAGITGAGLDQFNVILPEVTAGDQPVTISYVGFSTQAGVMLPIGPQ